MGRHDFRGDPGRARGPLTPGDDAMVAGWLLAVGMLLRQAREAHGLTVSDLAALCRMRPEWIDNAERGNDLTFLWAVERICLVLRLTTADLIAEAHRAVRAHRPPWPDTPTVPLSVLREHDEGRGSTHDA